MNVVAQVWARLLDACLICFALVRSAYGWYGGAAGWEGDMYVIRQGRYVADVAQWIGAAMYYGQYLSAVLILMVIPLTIAILVHYRTINLKTLGEQGVLARREYRVTSAVFAVAVLVPMFIYTFRIVFH